MLYNNYMSFCENCYFYIFSFKRRLMILFHIKHCSIYIIKLQFHLCMYLIQKYLYVKYYL